MATKRKTEDTQDQSAATAATEVQTDAQPAAEQAAEVQAPAAQTEKVQAAAPQTALEAKIPQTEGPILESLAVLADRHRVPAWQQAALLRFMGWLEDRRVSDTEYSGALEALKTRRLGGGRR